MYTYKYTYIYMYNMYTDKYKYICIFEKYTYIHIPCAEGGIDALISKTTIEALNCQINSMTEVN